MAEGFAYTAGRVYLVGYEVEEIFGSELRKRFGKLIMEFPSEWAYEGIYDNPF